MKIKKKNKTIPLYRQLDGTIYAFTCEECKCSWKVYHKAYHAENCSLAKK